jgi:hypothetical protein
MSDFGCLFSNVKLIAPTLLLSVSPKLIKTPKP